MSKSKVAPEFVAKFNEITNMNFEAQGVWFLNGFWDDMESEAENIWQYIQKMKAQHKEKENGKDLDEFEAHRFLESLGETLTILELRERLREIDQDNNNRMALIEYLIFKYNKTVEATCKAPQSDNKEELAKAQAMVDHAQKSLVELQEKLELQRQAEAAAKQAEEENKAALAELKRQEDDLARQKATLEEQTKLGGVKGARAVQELAKLNGEDPLPLRRASLNQGAAVRKAEKALKKAQEATTVAEAAARDAEKAFADATAYLDEVKSAGGSSSGAIWIMERNLAEAKKYLPKSRQ